MGFSSFYSGLSGLQAHGEKLDVIGNNLANVDTIGYKSARMTFQDIYAQTLGSSLQVGLGVQVANIEKSFTQGSLQTTGVATDFALQGNGFFVLRDPNAAAAYSRAGTFSFDKDGFLVNPSGQIVQGFTQKTPTGAINATGTPTDIQIPTGLTAPPNPTTAFTSVTNLNAFAKVDDPLTVGINEAQTFTTTVPVFDSLGGRHDVSVTFTPTDTNANGALDQWNYDVTVDGGQVNGGTAGTPFSLGAGTIVFDAQGQVTAPGGNVSINVPGWTNGGAGQAVTWNIFDPATGASNLTGYVGPSATAAVQQDGYPVGQLSFLSADSNGVISGAFTNGKTLQLAQLAVANFNSTAGLISIGRNNLAETLSSGPAAIGSANSGGRGSIVSGSLELSNVDITQELTDLIVAERGYQANSRVITTTDQIIQEALSLKR
ncbi:MAG: flagellar hook protein FlgE [Acidobacteria bacterium]|nr:flagellar hook protein FlgE [Acidobacteriota bacterium]